MALNQYGKQAPTKPVSNTQPAKPASTASSSSYLSRLAGQVGAGSSSGAGKAGSGAGGNSQIWSGSPSSNNMRSSIERRLQWVETAFKQKGGEGQLGGDPRMVVSSIRNRINALLTWDLSPKVRSELELIDKELDKLQ
ncbi:MAG: hypothetical protein PHG85_04475 [Candidatus Altiarchaeota archaeon]|nr:hypothetical protein [Candidatus Altiarchaeota archaeon]